MLWAQICSEPFISSPKYQKVTIAPSSFFNSFFDYNKEIVEYLFTISKQPSTLVGYDESRNISTFVESQHSANDVQNTIFPVVKSQNSTDRAKSPKFQITESPYSTNDEIKINSKIVES